MNILSAEIIRERFRDSSRIRRFELSVVGFYSPFLPFPFSPLPPSPLSHLRSRVFQSRARKMAGPPFRRRIPRNYRRATRKFISAMRVYRISGAGCQLQIGIYVHEGEVTLYLRVKTGTPVRARAAAAARNSLLRARFSARDFAV